MTKVFIGFRIGDNESETRVQIASKENLLNEYPWTAELKNLKKNKK